MSCHRNIRKDGVGPLGAAGVPSEETATSADTGGARYIPGMDWDDIRYFLTLARRRSVRAAAAQLGVSHSTVARRIEALETRLGTRLFDRHRDGFVLTGAGEGMVVAAERVEDEVCALARGLAGRDGQLAGPVHVTSSDEYVASLLLEDLAPWCAEHPEVELALTTDGRPFNLSKGEADLAVRALGHGIAPPEHLVGRRVAPIVCMSYVGRAHAARLDPDREGTRWLGFENGRPVEALVRSGSYPDLPVWGSFSTIQLMVRAVSAGLGLAVLPCYMGDAEPGLMRVAEPDRRHVADLWLLYHPDLRDNARVQAVRDVIRDGFARRQALFEGGPPAVPGVASAHHGARPRPA